MPDVILESFLRETFEQTIPLVEDSELVDLVPVGPPSRYMALFHCRGLVRDDGGEVREADEFAVHIWFTEDHLRFVDPVKLLCWGGPRNPWHPNISDRVPYVCIGHVGPAITLTSILYQLFEIITWQKYSPHDPLNAAAAQWARNQPRDRFPIDPRPLRWRA
ncbi:MAG: hypothetical protein CMJ18_11730 [Phycisphaeraceae bacterium]|nr:hypothetical protein [Phycisphaeraceae bacterium]